jgi:hypothetical protein
MLVSCMRVINRHRHITVPSGKKPGCKPAPAWYMPHWLGSEIFWYFFDFFSVLYNSIYTVSSVVHTLPWATTNIELYNTEKNPKNIEKIMSLTSEMCFMPVPVLVQESRCLIYFNVPNFWYYIRLHIVEQLFGTLNTRIPGLKPAPA